MNALTRIRTILSLGPRSVARVAKYRLAVGLGISSARRVSGPAVEGPFFRAKTPSGPAPAPDWHGDSCYFGWHRVPLWGACPDWFLNPFSSRRATGSENPWWLVPDFDPEVGDIKVIWELSRFDWVLAFAQQARAGRAEAVPTLEHWLTDWCRSNPPYWGPNWKCGQEASIRVLHLALAAAILVQDRDPARGLTDLISVHLARIAPTIDYAIGQDNNHGTSEAAALFVGGTWLREEGDARGARWAATGRRWLEDRVARLVADDGSFSQHSVNYHRMLLDTLCLAEAWRRHRTEPGFSPGFTAKAAAAARWLHGLVDPRTGDAPNLGANDGARLMPLTDSEYRDYRPSVQTAMALFAGERAYAPAGSYDHPLAWLGIPLPSHVAAPAESRLHDDGGYAVLCRDGTMALMRYPRFRFRPSHADALHVDLWREGRGLLRDGGTFSYAASPEDLAYFAGTAGHNTVQFDDRDQMPWLGRFLFGDWIDTEAVSLSTDPVPSARAAYHDAKGARHEREISLLPDRLIVRDRLSGQFHKAVLRWRLSPGAWTLDGMSVANGRDRLVLAVDTGIARIELIDGYESLYYLRKTKCPVVELEIRQPGGITTEYIWMP
jgi:hypothetical protein